MTTCAPATSAVGSIEIKALTFAYGSKPVFKELSWSFRTFPVALRGNNGAGKSTLLELISGCLKPGGGTITLPTAIDRIGYVPSYDVFLPWKTVGEQVAPHDRTLRADPELQALAARLLDDASIKSRFPRDLSSGQRQMLNLVTGMAEVLRPDESGDLSRTLLLLDEPSRSLSVGARKQLVTLLDAWVDRKCRLIVAAHDNDFAITVPVTEYVLS